VWNPNIGDCYASCRNCDNSKTKDCKSWKKTSSGVVESKIVNPGRRHQVEIWSHRLQILEKDIQWRCAVKDCESWKKTSSEDVESSSFKTRGLQAEEPTEEEIKEEEEMRDF
jgi:hypothetical protein